MDEAIVFDDMAASSKGADNMEMDLISESTKDVPLKFCPLCNSPIRLFFINFNEKLLMCENTCCEYPFGYDELQLVKEENDYEPDVELSSLKTCKKESQNASLISSVGWYELTQLNAALHSDTESICTAKELERLKEAEASRAEEKKLNEKLKNIEKMSMELIQEKNIPKRIKNEKMLRFLKNLEKRSGKSLLKPGEADRIKTDHPDIGLGELKINITPGDDENVSSIRIELMNKSA